MNKIERWRRCLDSQAIDRPPMTFWHHYQDASPAAHIRTYRQTGIDMVKMMSDGYNDITFGVPVTTAADWKHVKIPDMNHPFVTGQLDRIKGVVDAIGDECPIYYVVFSAFTLMRMSWDREMCFAHIKDPETRPYILGAMENIGTFLAEMSAHLITEGGPLWAAALFQYQRAHPVYGGAVRRVAGPPGPEAALRHQQGQPLQHRPLLRLQWDQEQHLRLVRL